MASTNHTATPHTPPPTPPATGAESDPNKGKSKADVLSAVVSLASQFSTCVEAFNLIHPHHYSERAQKIALAKLGIQQGRLLIFGDAVGISSPPKTIARHMIPSHPGATNPDPHLPVNFGVRDPRLDDEDVNRKIRAALDEIAGRPAHLTRDEMMDKYGLKTPKRGGPSAVAFPALDTNRLEAFREKYGLLQDLVRQSGIRGGNFLARRAGSMSMSHWVVKDTVRFDAFVEMVRVQVDNLISLMDVKEQVDRGMRTDIKAMAWHPDLSGPVVRQDWEKLRSIRDAVAGDYPEYIEVTDVALRYINEELRGSSLAGLRAAYQPQTGTRRRSSQGEAEKRVANVDERALHSPGGEKDKDKRPGFLSQFRLRSWGKSSKKARNKSGASPAAEGDAGLDPQRSLSADVPRDSTEENALTAVRSKSLSAMPDDTAPFTLDSTIQNGAAQGAGTSATSTATAPAVAEDTTAGAEEVRKSEDGEALYQAPTVDYGNQEAWEKSPLVHADTAQSLIDRHDMYRGVGRVDTRDIRGVSKEAAGV